MMADARRGATRRRRPQGPRRSHRLAPALLALVLCLASTAAAEDDVAVVNGAGPGSATQLVKLRKRLDAMGALRVSAPEVEAALGGDSVDVAPIKEAFEKFDYDRAEELLEQGITDLLTGGDPRMAVPLAELLHWRGLVEDELDDGGEAEMWFAASYRLDPDRVIDQEATPPRVRRVIEKARRAKGGAGRIRVDAEEDVRIEVDGRRHAEGDEVEAGMHLVVVTAPGRSPFAKLVRVSAGKTAEIEADLADESEVARARRARDAVVAATTDQARLKKARPLAKITGARKLLVIEGDDGLTVRVFDLDARTVSAPVALREASRPAVLAEMLGMDGGRRDKKWFERWYVWVGVAAVAGGGYATWEMTHRDPTSLRGF
jgi:hypothetical protein